MSMSMGWILPIMYILLATHRRAPKWKVVYVKWLLTDEVEDWEAEVIAKAFPSIKIEAISQKEMPEQKDGRS